ncbi:unnamed protein product [Prorocentrum cordatum]|uniref:Uncharacterized protein n=1 Tax=Prorocentrum cordatum TaxID=2364126 RepID=A0ABN9WQJ3_9DINO|nr:unnamed protein product [Polarella glacialis]
MAKERPPFVSFCMGGLSGGTAVVLSNPFEVVKTRYQLQGELPGSQKLYRSLWHAFSTIVREEGLFALQKGLAAGVMFQVVFNGLRIGLFDHVKPLAHVESAPNLSKLLAGASTGCLAAATCSPLYMVKCRLQSQATGAVATAACTQHGYTGVVHGLGCGYTERVAFGVSTSVWMAL